MHKTKLFLFYVLVLFSFNSIGQTKTKDVKTRGFEFQFSSVDSSINDAFCSVGKMPEFIGGMKKLYAFAKRKLYYPESAIMDDVQGIVILQFVIDKKGRVINRKILRATRSDLAVPCLKMLRQMPNWKAGRLNDKSVDTFLKWKIIFRLTD